MRAATPFVLALFSIILDLVLLLGCGGNATSSPAPPTAPTTPASSGGSSSASTQWSSTVNNALGTITVSTAGDVTVQVTGAKPSTTFDGFFCQYPSSYYYARKQQGCVELGQSLVTDASGNGKLTFHFPNSGAWAGAFDFAPGGDLNAYGTRIDTDVVDTTGTVSAPLLPASKVNPATGNPYIPIGSPQEAGSGIVKVNGGNVTVTVTGAAPNTKYLAGTNFAYGGSAGQSLGNLTTDAGGNATATFAGQPGTGTIVGVGIASAQNEYGLITGFVVP